MSQRWKNRPPSSRSHAEVATASPRALLVALLAALPTAAVKTPKDEQWCLLWAGTGCSSIVTEDLCLGSRDGRDWKGSPCTWCEGERCAESRCQAAGQVKGKNLTVTEAACSNRTAEESEIGEPVVRRGALFEEVHTPGQRNIGQACRHNTITDKKDSYYWIFSASSLESCQDRCRSFDNCTGVQYTPNTESCEVWWQPIHWSMAAKGQLCYRVAASDLPGRLKKPKSTYCLGLTLYIDGCTGIDDEHLCLTSRDGRKDGFINGSRIYGEPCVWCGGQACTSLNDNRCEPYDWLLQHTNDLAFSPSSSHFHNISVASCDEDTVSSTTMDFAPPLPAEVASLPPEVSVEFGSNTTTQEHGAFAAVVDEELGNAHPFQFPWWGWVLGLLAICGVVAAVVATLFGSGGRSSKPKARKKTRAIRQLEAESTDEITPMLEEASPASAEAGGATALDAEGPPEPAPAFPAMQPPLYQPSLFGAPPPLSMPMGRGVGMLGGAHLQQLHQPPQQRYSPVSVVEMPPMARAMAPLQRLPPPMRATAGTAEPFMPAQRQLF